MTIAMPLAIKKPFSTVFALLLVAVPALQAQSLLTPAPAQTIPVVLRNATVHFGDGRPATVTDVLVENGKITQVGAIAQTFKQSRDLDLAGKHIYPGLITLNSILGLQELELVRATADAQETGETNPSARALVAYNTDSRITPTVRSNGILLAQLAPRGGTFSGMSSVVQLDAWDYEDAAVQVDEGIYVNVPPLANPNEDGDRLGSQKRMDELLATLNEARAYAEATNPPYQAHLAALAPVMKRERTLYVRANTEKEILFAINLKTRYDINVVVVGGAESYLQAELLKKHAIPVVLARTHRLPSREDEDVDMPFRLPKILFDAGVPFAFGMDIFWNERNLPFQAGTAVAYGLPYEAAVQSLTLNAARILGIDGRYGSIAVGKSGTLIVSEGDLLDMRTSIVIHAFIDGREVNLDNHQKELYEKYKGK